MRLQPLTFVKHLGFYGFSHRQNCSIYLFQFKFVDDVVYKYLSKSISFVFNYKIVINFFKFLIFVFLILNVLFYCWITFKKTKIKVENKYTNTDMGCFLPYECMKCKKIEAPKISDFLNRTINTFIKRLTMHLNCFRCNRSCMCTGCWSMPLFFLTKSDLYEKEMESLLKKLSDETYEKKICISIYSYIYDEVLKIASCLDCINCTNHCFCKECKDVFLNSKKQFEILSQCVPSD